MEVSKARTSTSLVKMVLQILETMHGIMFQLLILFAATSAEAAAMNM